LSSELTLQRNQQQQRSSHAAATAAANFRKVSDEFVLFGMLSRKKTFE